MEESTRLQGLRSHNLPCQVHLKTTRDLKMETHQESERTKASDETWDLQHTFDSLEKSLILSHLLFRSAHGRYEKVKKMLKS